MKKYEAVIILNPNLSSEVDTFKKDFEKLLIAIHLILLNMKMWEEGS